MNYFFDLDGTLTDPGAGITKCIRHALTSLGYQCPDDVELRNYVGPPLQRSLARLLRTDDVHIVANALHLYRDRFIEKGMFENHLYPDVREGLERLAADGHPLWVVTSKPHVYASKILAHFGIAQWFEGVYGSELDGSNSEKVDLVRLALAHENLEPSNTWMIGDRAEDVRGGRMNGTHTAGALWGYGTKAELLNERPDVLIASMGDLPI